MKVALLLRSQVWTLRQWQSGECEIYSLETPEQRTRVETVWRMDLLDFNLVPPECVSDESRFNTVGGEVRVRPRCCAVAVQFGEEALKSRQIIYSSLISQEQPTFHAGVPTKDSSAL